MMRQAERPAGEPPTSAEGLLGPLEYEVLQEVWSEAPVSVRDVLETLNAQRDDTAGLAYTTVMTVLARLHDKGLLAREKVGRSYEYTPLFTEAELVAHLSHQEVAALVDRFGAVALAEFAAALEEADPDLLRRAGQLADLEEADPEDDPGDA